MAEVTQADREAAAKYIGDRVGDSIPDASLAFDRIPNGKADSHDLVQAFARHRTEAVKPLVEALKEIGIAANLSAALSDPDEREPWEMIEARCDAALRSVQS